MATGDPRVDVTIGANVQPFAAGMQAAIGKLQQFITLGAMTMLAKQAIDFGSRLNDLSQRTQVSVEWLQAVGYAAKQTGSSIDELANAVTELRRAQAQALGGSTGDISAFSALGISMEDLKSLGAEQLFDRVADAVHRSKGGIQEVNAAISVLGRVGKSLITGMVEGFGKLSDEARDFGLIVSNETVQALDALGDRMGAVSLAIQVMTGKLLVNIASLNNWISVAKLAVLLSSPIGGPRVLAGFVAGGGGIGGVIGALIQAISLLGSVNRTVDDYTAREDELNSTNRSSGGGVGHTTGGRRRGSRLSGQSVDDLQRIGLYVSGSSGPGNQLLRVQNSALGELRAMRRAVERLSDQRARGDFQVNW